MLHFCLDIICIVLMAIMPVAAMARVAGVVSDYESGCSLPNAKVEIVGGKSVAADAQGRYVIDGVAGRKTIVASYEGFLPDTAILNIGDSLQIFDFRLKPDARVLDEVVVTANEKRGLTSASQISRDAMAHVQPTSFADLLALLPGGCTTNPVMDRPTHIALREAGISSDDYNTSALGTQFVIDNAPMITDANMQSVRGEINNEYGSKTSINAGVDMRNISTDNIESVEVVRGVPSVKYGDLTSGVVIIKRRLTDTPLEARFKADLYGKMVSVGKGLRLRAHDATLAADLSYLDSRSDPRDRHGRFHRITSSVRYSQQWETDLSLSASLDYAGNLDREKPDPEIELLPEDSYKSSYNNFSFRSGLAWTPTSGLLKRLECSVSAQYTRNVIERSRFTQLDRDRVAVTTYAPGEYDATILPSQYIAYHKVEGQPLSIYANLSANMMHSGSRVTHSITSGATWTWSKNLGRGETYDLTRPLNPMSSSYRPRSFRDIPSSQQLAVYAEDLASATIGANTLMVQAGLRLAMMPRLGRKYYLNNRPYVDPRVNVQWIFPGINVCGHPLVADVSAGAGWLTKMPTLSQLFPDKTYLDFVQLNYWNADAAKKRVNVRTYVEDPTNTQLRAARNLKCEVKLGLEYRRNYLSVTIFREDMKSGFRHMAVCKPFAFKKYDAAGIDGSALASPPALEDLTYASDTILGMYGRIENGSRTIKSGVEFQFSSARIERIRTRLTINGAWFRTTYENSAPSFQSANTTTLISGVRINDKYVGFYQWQERYIREQCNTNFTIDTDVARLGLRFSVTAECTWFKASQMGNISGTPVSYIDTQGQMHPYTEQCAEDLWLKHLVKTYNPATFRRSVSPFYMYVNFKATKSFGKHIAFAIFVDRLIDCVNDYRKNGMTVRRSPQSPYFGMEINLKL